MTPAEGNDGSSVEVRSSLRKVFFVTHVLREAAVAVLADQVDVVYALAPEERLRLAEPDLSGHRARRMEESLAAHLPTASVLHSIGPVTREMLEAAPELQAVVVPGSGYDHVDVEAASDLSIPVVHAAGASYEPVAEHVVGLMLALTKWIATTDRASHRDRTMASNRAMLLGLAGTPSMLWGKTVGIVGFGYIGRSLADKCRMAFGMRVLAYDPYFDPSEAERLGVTLVEELDELLGASDFVSLNCPLTPATQQLIGADQLSAMKPTAYLVNAARGPVVDTAALVKALEGGAIAGAGLDVTDPEPLPEGHPLFDLDNVVLTPHIGGISAESLARNAVATSNDVLAVLGGRRPKKLANPGVWADFLERRWDGS